MFLAATHTDGSAAETFFLTVCLQPCNSFTSSGSEGSDDKRRRFEQMRKQHYNMKDALLKVSTCLPGWSAAGNSG